MEAEFFLAPYKGQHAGGANSEYSIQALGPFALLVESARHAASCNFGCAAEVMTKGHVSSEQSWGVNLIELR